MDTKWNRTDKPAVIEGTPLKEGKPRGGRVKALAGFLAFVLGVSLTVSSLGNAGARIVWERDPLPRWAEDWQETEGFRQEVASLLRSFLTIGAGGAVDYYGYEYWRDYGGTYNEAIVEAVSGGDGWWRTVRQSTDAIPVDRGSSAASSEAVPDPPEEEQREPDAAYQNDKNVLYYINTSDKRVSYSNGGSLTQFMGREIEGYNFYLTFRNGKVSIQKDGAEVDVYGDGVYDEDSQWFVPGYYNFPATDQLDGVKVYMAVRETPARYYAVDYKTGESYNSSTMYYLAQQVRESWDFYSAQAVLFGVGCLCLAAWGLLWKQKALVDRKIASWTAHVWTEARFLLMALCGAWAFLPGLAGADFFWALRYGYAWDYGYSFPDLASQLARVLLANIPALLAFIWLV